MSTRTERIVASVIVASAGCLVLHWWVESRSSPFARGEAEARLDLTMGHYEVKHSGKPPYPNSPYWQAEALLFERYGVRNNWAAGCMVSWEFSEYMKGYNQVSKAGIRRHFGKNIFAECEKDASAE